MIKKNKSRNAKLIKSYIYLYLFFIFYMPRVSDLLIGVKIEVFSGLLLIFMLIPWITTCKSKASLIKVDKNIFLLIIGIFLSALYFAIRASLDSYDIRIMQNLFIVVQIFHIIIAIDFMKYIGFDKYDMIRVLLNLSLLQGFITILMILFPSLKNIALSLYYLNREENIFISRMRIYGISGDYTFFTPIYHGILASTAFFLSIFKDRKYFVYLPFILVTILLNGRFGLLIFGLSPIAVVLHFIFRGKISFKMMRISILTIIIIILGILSLSIISPFTYDWIVGGIKDTINLIIYNEKTGNYVALAGYFLSVPEGWGIIFGEGFRLYGGQGTIIGYNPSDIGYVNDMFMGGIIYLSILYGSIILFLLRKPIMNNLTSKFDNNLHMLISKFLVITLLLSNYKGEVMRGGIVLLLAIFLKIVISYEPYIEEK
ncbi:hypothetical protein E8P77_01075 [Soehngenia saccharolytica]|nr:hypothetical protein E8P77_01075 [Soehngenia saccharolytica]